jgi:hypothetical protein
MVAAIKDHYKKREKDIKDSQVTRQERAVFLKAKLMLVRRDMGINALFEMATETPAVATQTTETKDMPVVAEASDKLSKAEFFIRDLGVWDHYQKFLEEKKSE